MLVRIGNDTSSSGTLSSILSRLHLSAGTQSCILFRRCICRACPSILCCYSSSVIPSASRSRTTAFPSFTMRQRRRLVCVSRHSLSFFPSMMMILMIATTHMLVNSQLPLEFLMKYHSGMSHFYMHIMVRCMLGICCF